MNNKLSEINFTDHPNQVQVCCGTLARSYRVLQFRVYQMNSRISSDTLSNYVVINMHSASYARGNYCVNLSSTFGRRVGNKDGQM